MFTLHFMLFDGIMHGYEYNNPANQKGWIILKKRMIIALMMTVLMILSAGCSLIQINPERDAQRVVAEVNGVKLYKGDFMALYESNKSSFGVTDDMESDSGYEDTIHQLKDYVLEYMIETELAMQKAEDMGITLTADEEDELIASVDETLESYRENYRSAMEAEGETVDETLVEAMLQDYLDSNHMDRDFLIESARQSKLVEKLKEEVAKDVTVTDDEVRETYDAYVQDDMENFTSNTSQYEQYLLSDQPVYYNPEGYRYVQQVLISFDDETLSELNTLRQNGDDEAADQLRESSAEPLKAKAQEVIDAFNNGTDFQTLMETYSDDDAYLTYTKGYPISESTTTYVDEFKEAALSLKAVGDISGMTISDYGIHILYYASDIEPGEVPYSEVSADLREEVLDEAKNEVYNDNMDSWMEEASIKRHNKVIY